MVREQEYAGELHANLIDALGTAMVSGQLPAGHVLTLDAIGAEHSVSRSVAREAVRVLESMGMVASRRRVGITIQPARQWNVFDPRLIRWRLDAGDRAAQLLSLSELRRGFEPAAAALAARRADPQQCRIMAAAVSDMVVHGSHRRPRGLPASRRSLSPHTAGSHRKRDVPRSQ
jgi:DNA-binding FadR family transcriptional regulator